MEQTREKQAEALEEITWNNEKISVKNHKVRSSILAAKDIIFNINAEFSSALDTRPIAVRAKSAVFSAAADIIAVSGPMPGQGVDSSDLAAVKEALPDTPVFANTGVRTETVGEILKIADGCVVGTALKFDGYTWNAVDRDRVRRFMDAVEKAR